MASQPTRLASVSSARLVASRDRCIVIVFIVVLIFIVVVFIGLCIWAVSSGGKKSSEAVEPLAPRMVEPSNGNKPDAAQQALRELCLAMLCLNEFIYVD